MRKVMLAGLFAVLATGLSVLTVLAEGAGPNP